jgi:hypothetical protein
LALVEFRLFLRTHDPSRLVSRPGIRNGRKIKTPKQQEFLDRHKRANRARSVSQKEA